MSTPFWPVRAGEVARLTGGELSGDAAGRLERVATDSRAGVRAGDLFVGLPGPHFDGGCFAAQVLTRGAGAALVGPGHAAPLLGPGQAWIQVADPLAALQALAAEARRRFSGLVLAITGSNGKTTVKDMLVAILGRERAVTASPRSYNSQVGVALTLLGLDPAAELAIIECGLSLPGEMERLAAMVAPDCGVLTTVGEAHLEGLGSREAIASEKSRLFSGLAGRLGGWVLTLESEDLARAALTARGAPVLTVAASGNAFELDAALAAAAARRLGAPEAVIEAGLTAWSPAPMRLEISTTPRGLLLINDAYGADPLSMEAALTTLERERGRGRALAVLAGMDQLGRAREEAHGQVGRRVAALALDRLIGVGAGGAEIARAALAAGLPAERVHMVTAPEEAAQLLEEHCRPGDRVLLKGSRPERLERVAALLFDSVASARLTVDLDTLAANFHRLRRAAGGRAVMAVVKSFGYGLDAVRIARALEGAGADYFAVAYPDEGVLLRDHGITTPILVQNLLAHEADKIVGFGLTAQLSSAEQAIWLAREAEEQRRAVSIHLKVDTGMGRAGALPEDVLAVAEAVRSSAWLTLEGLMTHFAAADDPARDDFTREQIARFDAVRARLTEAGFRFRFEHAAASAAISRFPEAHYSMVRSGLALFGYVHVAEHIPLGQVPVLRLTTRVVSVKELPAGHRVGYGCTFAAEGGPRRIAVVALGYSDGYPLALSNRGFMLVGGRRCPVVGRVSMDVTTLDVTELAESVVPGDEVVVFGPGADEPSLAELAELAGTIPYELLTRISPRVRRIFASSA
ncbi:MAG TPA: alanine racemase [Thermoanaerobaculia bacterium]|nr:alanine racemase [Thermoanaerobaculia bacterium]